MYSSNPSSCSKLPSVSSWPAESEWAPDVQPPHLRMICITSSHYKALFGEVLKTGQFGKLFMKYLMIIYLLIVEWRNLFLSNQPVRKGSSPIL